MPGSGRAVWVEVACTSPEKGRQGKEKMKLIHKETVMWWRLMRTILRRRRGKKRRRDWVTLTKWNRKEGERAPKPRRERGCMRQSESKSFSQLHRDRLFYLNCVLWTSSGLSGRSQPTEDRGWISGKVGRKCNVEQDGTFPWKENLTVAINYLAREIKEGGDKTIHRQRRKVSFK